MNRGVRLLRVLFSQGKTLQENAEAWRTITRRFHGQKGWGISPPPRPCAASRPAQVVSAPSTSAQAAAPGHSASGLRFAVGFSYAGEDRAVVAPVAERLAERLGEERVLFDRFHEAELARPDLDVYLPRLYRDQTELIVVVLSPDYPKKRWCGLEWRWIRQLILGSAQERIMLLQIGDPGDLSELGIVSGDGYLDISRRSAEAITSRILERMEQQGIPLHPPAPQPAGGGRLGLLAMPSDSSDAPPAPVRLPARRGPPVAALLAGGAALLAGGWLLGRPQLAQWQVRQGDQAYLAYTKLADESRLQQAGQAWQRATALDPGQPEAHARLGFLADIEGELTAAEAHWKQAATLAPPESPQARSFRSGLADVLAQQPGRRKDALDLYDADRFHPRSAIEAAMLRWSEPAQVAQAHEAISERALGEALAGKGQAEAPWGFKANGGLLLFESWAHQRCLLVSVRAATARLAGDATTSAPPLATADCQGVQESVKELLCTRLGQASANPRAAATGRWLGCPPNAAPAAQGKGAS